MGVAHLHGGDAALDAANDPAIDPDGQRQVLLGQLQLGPPRADSGTEGFGGVDRGDHLRQLWSGAVRLGSRYRSITFGGLPDKACPM